jgi:hypothetical protein
MTQLQAQERYAAALEKLLMSVPAADRETEMYRVESLLEDNGIAIGNPPRGSARAFARALFLSNPNVVRMVKQAMERGVEIEPENPEALILALLPSDHHLD